MILNPLQPRPIVIALPKHRRQILDALALLAEYSPYLYRDVCQFTRFIIRLNYFGFHSRFGLAVLNRKEMSNPVRLACSLVHLAAHLETKSEDEFFPDFAESCAYEDFGYEVEQ